MNLINLKATLTKSLRGIKILNINKYRKLDIISEFDEFDSSSYDLIKVGFDVLYLLNKAAKYALP